MQTQAAQPYFINSKVCFFGVGCLRYNQQDHWQDVMGQRAQHPSVVGPMLLLHWDLGVLTL